MNKEVDWDLIGFIVASKYRRRIVEQLSKGVITPKHISDATSVRINHVSNILGELSKKNVVECVNPEAKVGRLYKLTEKGRVISKALENIDKSL